MAATRISESSLATTYGSSSEADKNAVNAAGGLLLLSVPADFTFARNASIYRCTAAMLKTTQYNNPNGWREVTATDGQLSVTYYVVENQTGAASLEICDANGNDVVTLTASYIKGEAVIDAGAVIRTLYKRHFTQGAGNVFSEPACSVTYQSEGFNVLAELLPFRTLNGVAQIGEAQVVPIGTAVFLEDLPTAHIYAGYPWSYVERAGSTAAATPYTGVTIPANEVRCVRIDTTTASGITSQLQLAGIEYAEVHDCTDENPMWVRWLNRKGGISYWMFSKRQTLSYEAGSTLLREVIVEDTGTAVSNREEYGKSASVRVTFGAGNLYESEAAALRRLAVSPIVEWWDGSRWTAITLESYSEDHEKGNDCTDLEFTFNLPSIRL